MAQHSDSAVPFSRSKTAFWYEGWWVDFVGVLLVFYLFAGNKVPEVNEPHYWTKAAHFWNPDYCRGDLFLESGDVHWAFFGSLGSLTLFLPLAQAVWISRWITWVAIALGWTLMTHRIFDRSVESTPEVSNPGLRKMVPCRMQVPLVSTLLATLWLAGMHWWNWAGEWVVGGSEAKGLAYAFSFAGIYFLAKRRWTMGWCLLGIGSVFHVVIGMWVIGSCWIATLFAEIRWHGSEGQSFWLRLLATSRSQAAGWILCGVAFLSGAIPAVQMDLGTDRDATTEAAMQQVYKRLGHHLSPIKFNDKRWIGFMNMAIVNLALITLLKRNGAFWERFGGLSLSETVGHERRGEETPRESSSARRSERKWIVQTKPRWIVRSALMVDAPPVFRYLMLVCCVAFGLAMVGLLIDLTLSPRAPGLAAALLRYYWFRWNDVTFPMLGAMLLVAISSGQLRLAIDVVERRGNWLAKVCTVLIVVVSGWLLYEKYTTHWQEGIPAGEKAHLMLKSDPVEVQQKQYADWLRVCEWIRSNTSTEGLWLTPRRQQSFKWQTGRAELACWKDMPQNAKAVVEWDKRLKKAFQFDADKQLQPLNEKTLEELRELYGIRYVLLDLRVEGQTIPKWNLLYPSPPDNNGSFAVLEWIPQVPDSEQQP